MKLLHFVEHEIAKIVPRISQQSNLKSVRSSRPTFANKIKRNVQSSTLNSNLKGISTFLKLFHRESVQKLVTVNHKFNRVEICRCISCDVVTFRSRCSGLTRLHAS